MSTPGENPRPHSGGRRRKQYQWGNKWAAKSLKWVAIPVVVVLVLGLVGFFTARPAYRAFKIQRAERLAREAESLFAAEKYQESLKNLGIALLLAPQSFDVNLAAARLYTKIGQPTALNHWQLVINDARASRADRLAYLDAAFQVERYDLLQQELGSRNVLDPLDDELLWRKLRLLVVSSRYDDAVEHARVAQFSRPELPERELLLGEVLIRSSRPEWQQEGRRLLMGLALVDTDQQANASKILRVLTVLAPADAELIARALERKRQPELADLLEGARLRLVARPEQKDQVVETLLAEVGPREFGDRLVVADWLLDSGEPRPVMDLVSAAEAATNSLAMTFRVESMTARADWSSLDTLLASTNALAGIHPAVIDAMTATRENARGNAETTEARLRLAVDKATRAPEARRLLAIAARAAERAGRPLIAVDAYERLMEFPELTVPAARQVLRLLDPQPELARLHHCISRLHDFTPGDAGVAFEFSYLSTLLGKDLKRAAESLAGIPTGHPYRALLAAFLKAQTDTTGESLAEFEAAAGDWRTLPPRWQAVYIDVLGRAQQREAARTNARQVDRSRLKTEEKALIEKWLA